MDDDAFAVFDRLVRVQILLWNAVDAELRREHDLPLTWFEPMRVIARRGTARINDIVDDLVITAGGASKLVDRMQAAGLVRRTPDPADRRSARITLTTVGESTLSRAEQTARTTLDDTIGISDTDRRRLAATLDQIRGGIPRER
ncbi:MarR family winged helix-turn-helix transcriptional regulator [Williamsia deligens]|uniref:MarR family winged helix-turn-helix transcriptional regulator n=1 Tax=Williamsia deligens TaxID=321325 RepID=A0ABW3GFY7_9NOCA|nr:MarR family transcriptional regulator [Williamsia deligens]MCP2195126.1 DNA-binding transcriptional regulator, MarR family [Williamsia deligens]